MGSLSSSGSICRRVAYLFALGPADMAMSDTIAATSVTARPRLVSGKIVALTIRNFDFQRRPIACSSPPLVFSTRWPTTSSFPETCRSPPSVQDAAAAIIGLGAWSAV